MHYQYDLILLNVKKNLKYLRDQEIRKNASILIDVIESFLDKKFKTIEESCKRNGITKKTFYKWLGRFVRSNYSIYELKPRSRKPKHSPKRYSQEIIEKIIEYRKKTGGSGGKIISYCLWIDYGIRISHSGIDKELRRLKIHKSYKVKKNPFKKRYNAKEPLERVQVDTLYIGFHDDQGNPIILVNIIDDHSRFAFSKIYTEKSNWNSALAIKEFISKYGKPKIIQTDNGVEFTYEYISHLNSKRQKERRISAFESVLEEYQIQHKKIRPYTPQHNGKVERFHRTLLEYIYQVGVEGKPLEEIEKITEEFLEFYNYKRPHSGIKGSTPSVVFF